MPIPSLPGLPKLVDACWGTRSGKWSFIISFIEGYGYGASFKDAKFQGPQSASQIEGSPFTRFVDAELACRNTLRQLRAPA